VVVKTYHIFFYGFYYESKGFRIVTKLNHLAHSMSFVPKVLVCRSQSYKDTMIHMLTLAMWPPNCKCNPIQEVFVLRRHVLLT
jgi:hypothetical protein